MSDNTKVNPEDFKLRLQLETTLLVWVRTSLALMAFGFVLCRFGLFLRELAEMSAVSIGQHQRLPQANGVTGTVMILLGVVVLLVAVIGHQRAVRRLARGDLTLPPRWSLAALLSLFLAAVGMCMAAYLAAVEW
jgi:putative membrane protein